MRPTDTPVVRFVVGAMSIALLLTGVVAANRAGGSIAARGATAAAAGSGVPATGGAAMRTSAGEMSAAPGAALGSTGEAAASGATAAAVDGAVGAAVGLPSQTYTYIWTRRGGAEGEASGEFIVAVTDEGAGAKGHRQSIRYSDGDGENATTEHVVWRDDGMHVTRSTHLVKGEEARCAWSPQWRKLALPLKAGSTWSYATACTLQFARGDVEVQRRGEFTAVERTTIEVAGDKVEVWKIEGVEQVVYPSYTVQEETTAYFSPAHRLVLKSSRATKATEPWQSGSVIEESEIKALPEH